MTDISIQALNSADSNTFHAIMNGPAEDAARWLHAAAEHGVTEAQVRYGQFLLEGKGSDANPQEAFQWFKLAAGQGHEMAMNMVGRCYENGWGVQADELLATYWFRLAAHADLDWGMYNYATSLALGRGVETNHEEALAWLRKAVLKGHSKSWNLLGSFHEDGWACDVDLNAAEHCYRKAAEGGDFRGQFNVGRLLVMRNEIKRAATWLQAAYQNPSVTAAFRQKMVQFLNTSNVAELTDLARRLSPASIR